jgi:hypothetical protein
MRVTVTTSPGARCLSMSRSWRRSLCAPRYLLAINLGATCAAYLLKLNAERLSVDADAGIAETAVLRFTLDHILRQP